MKNLKTFLISREPSPFRDIAVLLTFFGVSFFLFLGKYGLIEPDEGRYAEIPREMLEKGDFITPTLNYVHYFEKPPLHYWLTALSFKLFGLNEFAARFTGVCAGLLTIVIVYHTARILFDRRAGFFSACILGLSTGFAVQSRINLTDMTLTFFLTASLCCFMLVCAEQVRSKQLYLCLFYLAAGCSVLTKGLIGIVLPGGIIFLHLLFTQNWSQLRQLRLFMGGLLFFAIVAPWFILVSLRNPGFAHFFFIHEHFQRYVSTIHHHYQPFWYFAPILLLLMLPWSPYIIRSIRTAFRVPSPPERRLTTFLVLWLTLIFAFFSFSQSKLIPYILPVIPPLAMLMGKMFSDRVEQHEDSFFAIEHVFMCVVLLATALLMAFYPHVREFGGQLTATGLVRPDQLAFDKNSSGNSSRWPCPCLSRPYDGFDNLAGQQNERYNSAVSGACVLLIPAGDCRPAAFHWRHCRPQIIAGACLGGAQIRAGGKSYRFIWL